MLSFLTLLEVALTLGFYVMLLGIHYAPEGWEGAAGFCYEPLSRK